MYRLYGFFRLEQVTQKLMEQWLSLLPLQRQQKALRYRRAEDRKLSVVAYMLLLHGLYEAYGLRNPEIACTETGKPYLPHHPNIHFNISHCEKGCICGISDRPIGVDIQQIRPVSPAVVNRCCSEAEKALLLQATDPAAEFTRMWAMKESYVKMTGKGIGTNLVAVDTAGVFRHIPVIVQPGYVVAVCQKQEEAP